MIIRYKKRYSVSLSRIYQYGVVALIPNYFYASTWDRI